MYTIKDHNQISRIKSLSITGREYEVLQLISLEYSTREIAGELFISYDTALTHRKSLLKKLNVSNAAGLIRAAFEKRVLDPGYRANRRVVA